MRISFYFCLLILATKINCHSQYDWERTDLIWSAGMECACDVRPIKDPYAFFATQIEFDPLMYQNIKSGDIVWLPCCFIDRFANEILPHVSHPFVLLINDSRDADHSFPSNCPKGFDVEAFLLNENIIHVFAQNCDYAGKSDKVSHFPIGIDFHTISYKGKEGGWGEKGSPLEQEKTLKEIRACSKPLRERKRLAFVDFHHSDTMHGGFNRYLQFGEDRKEIFAKLLSTKLIEHGTWMRRYSLWRKKAEYAFSISPPGNGIDCHRTWEDLALGCIVIVKTSSLDPMFENLPVVIVSDWSEITRENMDHWLELYADAVYTDSFSEKLTHRYWYNQIFEKVARYRN